jgi:hypothetical protein
LKPWITAGSTLREAVQFALLQQGVILVLASMILDGGRFAQMCAYGVAGFWGGFAVLRMRRRNVLTRLDFVLIRFGTIPVCALSFFLTLWIWRLRGYG